MIRVGAVEFLNARPLVRGLHREPWCEVRFDVPSVCARLLHAGEIDLGLVPAIEVLRGSRSYDVVAGPVVSCRGAVESVALFSRVAVHQIRTIALDTSSRSSATLLRILCARHFAIEPDFIELPPDLPQMVQQADAALLIGDPALEAPWRDLGLEMIDLGQAWWDMTGLPFVFAVWAARAGALAHDQAGRLRHVRDAGVAAIPAIARDYGRGDEARERRALHYLGERIRYDLDEDARRGLATYFQLAVDLGLAPASAAGPSWIGEAPTASVRA
jgi:chorismate dehydratase